jgi:hypothetical protein
VSLLHDYQGVAVRLTEERLAHILDHPEMSDFEPAISETLRYPESVIQSLSDDQARLYYRRYTDTPVGEKLLCVVVKFLEGDAFVLTAYLTDKLKGGEILWTAEL